MQLGPLPQMVIVEVVELEHGVVAGKVGQDDGVGEVIEPGVVDPEVVEGQRVQVPQGLVLLVLPLMLPPDLRVSITS